MSIVIETETKNAGKFRYGQKFTYDNVKYAIAREGYAYWFVERVVIEALVNRFDIVDGDGILIEDNDFLIKEFAKHKRKVILAIKYSRGYGKGLQYIFIDKKEHKLVIRAFDPKHYTPEYNHIGEIIKVEAIEEIVNYEGDPREYIITNDKLDAVYEIITREGDKTGEGRSILEPIWDTLFGLSQLDQNGVYYAIRVGGGLKIMYMDYTLWSKASVRDQIIENAESVNAGNGIIVIPVFNDIENVKYKLDFLSGEQIDFIALRDLLLGTLSIATGIPRQAWLGDGNEENTDKYDYIKDIQETYEDFLLWVLKKIAEFHNKSFPEDTRLRFKVREQLTENDRLNILQQQVNIAQRMGYAINKEQIENIIGLKLEETENVNPQEEDKNFVERDMDANSNNSTLAQQHAEEKKKDIRP